MPSGPDRAAGVDEMVITYAIGEQFRELIVPWGNTTPGPPTHPTLLLDVFLNMESNRGILLF